VDVSVFKNIPIGERFKVQLRAEIFNLLNRINLAPGGGSASQESGFVTDTISDFNGATASDRGRRSTCNEWPRSSSSRRPGKANAFKPLAVGAEGFSLIGGGSARDSLRGTGAYSDMYI
jgi:hypothetical protein